MPATEASFQVSSSALHSEADEDFSAVMRYRCLYMEDSDVETSTYLI